MNSIHGSSAGTAAYRGSPDFCCWHKAEKPLRRNRPVVGSANAICSLLKMLAISEWGAHTVARAALGSASRGCFVPLPPPRTPRSSAAFCRSRHRCCAARGFAATSGARGNRSPIVRTKLDQRYSFVAAQVDETVVSAIPLWNSSSVTSYSQAGMTWIALSAASRITPIGSLPSMTAMTCSRYNFRSSMMP